MVKTHYLKTLPRFFLATKLRKKAFELRINDRNFEVGDTIVLQEYTAEDGYTGAELYREITYILFETPFVPEKYICMSVI